MKFMIMLILCFWLLPAWPAWGNSEISELRQRFEKLVEKEGKTIQEQLATDYIGEDYTDEELEELIEYFRENAEKRKQRSIERWKHTQEPE